MAPEEAALYGAKYSSRYASRNERKDMLRKEFLSVNRDQATLYVPGHNHGHVARVNSNVYDK